MLCNRNEHPLVLVADDDADDRLLVKDAFQSVGLDVEVCFVENGEELLDSLQGCGGHAAARLPDLILLDLNMPVMDGREVLRLIKKDRELRSIPVVILTTSQSEQDLAEAFASGANAYVPKPRSFDELAEMLKALCGFWFRWCLLPTRHQVRPAAWTSR